MFIAIDIGNTHTVVGIYKKEMLTTAWRLTSSLNRSEDELAAQLLTFLARNKVTINSVDAVGISSVVPKLTKEYVSISRKHLHRKPLIVSTALKLGIRIHYDKPRSLGADRICNTIAGYAKYGGPLIVIDFGTATTYDVIASNGDFLGGVIAPGIETSAADLHKRTAKLPEVKLHLPGSAICTNTASSMQAGILWGAIDSMEGIVKRIQAELYKLEKKQADVIATGGFSKFVSKHTHVIQYLEESLVLDGIRLIYNRAKGKADKNK